MTITPLAIGVWASSAVAAGVTWNPSDKGTFVALSSGNLVATSTGSSGADVSACVRATVGFTTGGTGKYYWEVVINSFHDYTQPQVGVMSSAQSLSSALGYGNPGVFASHRPNLLAFRNGSLSNTGFNYVANDVWGCAVDINTRFIWMSRNNSWNGGNNPGGGTGQLFTLDAATLYYPCCRVYRDTGGGSATQCTAHFSSGSWTYAAPTGFGAL